MRQSTALLSYPLLYNILLHERRCVDINNKAEGSYIVYRKTSNRIIAISVLIQQFKISECTI